MVNGLFPEDERANVLDMLEKSVVFLTAENIADVLRRESYARSAWTLANLYLGSIGAELLSETAVSLSAHCPNEKRGEIAATIRPVMQLVLMAIAKSAF